jgi:hypothetical protein
VEFDGADGALGPLFDAAAAVVLPFRAAKRFGFTVVHSF